MKYEVPEDNVSACAEFLDDVHPGWEKKVNIKTLNMADHSQCILGQIFGDYTKAVKKLFGDAEYASSDNCCFASSLCKEEWIEEINKRINKYTWDWAVAQMKAGKKIRRPHFVKDWYWHIQNGCIIASGKVDDEWHISLETLEATDYELYNPLTFNQLRPGDKFKFDTNSYVYTKCNGDNYIDEYYYISKNLNPLTTTVERV